jgi:glutaconate CoA-transferase subunit A
VDAVVPVPMGAYPTACFNYYDYDPLYLKHYGQVARDDQRYSDYLRRMIMDPPDHAAFLTLQPKEQLGCIKADPVVGYAVGLDRT